MTTQLHSGLEHTRGGKIRTAAKSKSNTAIRLLLISLVVITAAALLTFDYKNIDLGKALADTLHNIRTVFLSPKLVHDSFGEVLESLLVTFCLGALATILGMVLAFFAALLCASNIANPKTAALIKGIVALVRAVPTVLWVLIFAVSAGLDHCIVTPKLQNPPRLEFFQELFWLFLKLTGFLTHYKILFHYSLSSSFENRSPVP